jgi:hypothetical protein
LGEQFGLQLQEALIRRGKDFLLSAFQNADEKTDPEDVLLAMRGLNALLSVINDIGREHSYQISPMKATIRDILPESIVYDVTERATGSFSKLRMLFRATGAVDGRGRQLQARINLELDLKAGGSDSSLQRAFLHTVRHRDNAKKSSTVRMGIDLDSFYDPPRVSLDLGRSPDHGVNRSTEGCVLGRVQAAADKVSGNHNVASFDASLSEPGTFERVVMMFRRAVDRV